MDTTKKVKASVSMRNTGEGKVYVEWNYSVFSRKVKGTNRTSCFIPGYNIRYSVIDEADIRPKGKVMMKIFFDHFFIHSEKKIKSFIIDMHKRGFKALSMDSFIMKELLKNNHLIDTKLNAITQLPEDDEDVVNEEAEMEVQF